MPPLLLYSYLELSLFSYTWHEAWKESNISPLPNVDTTSQHQDFRGINVAPVIASCFEKIVYHKFSKHAFEENLGPTQYAYLEGCNCTDALINIQYNDRKCRYVRLFAMDFATVHVFTALILFPPFNLEFYRKFNYLTREFHVKLHAKTDIARIAKR